VSFCYEGLSRGVLRTSDPAAEILTEVAQRTSGKSSEVRDRSTLRLEASSAKRTANTCSFSQHSITFNASPASEVSL
jgi:hypothetical protein